MTWKMLAVKTNNWIPNAGKITCLPLTYLRDISVPESVVPDSSVDSKRGFGRNGEGGENVGFGGRVWGQRCNSAP